MNRYILILISLLIFIIGAGCASAASLDMSDDPLSSGLGGDGNNGPFYVANESIQNIGNITPKYLGNITPQYLGNITPQYLGNITPQYLGNISIKYMKNVSHDQTPYGIIDFSNSRFGGRSYSCYRIPTRYSDMSSSRLRNLGTKITGFSIVDGYFPYNQSIPLPDDKMDIIIEEHSYPTGDENPFKIIYDNATGDETPTTETNDNATDEGIPTTETPNADGNEIPTTETPNADGNEIPTTETPNADSDEPPAAELPSVETGGNNTI